MSEDTPHSLSAIEREKLGIDHSPPTRVLLVSSKYPPEYAGSGLRAHRTYLRLRERFGTDFSVLCSSVTENTCATYEIDGCK